MSEKPKDAAATYDIGRPLERSLCRNICARLGLSTSGSVMTENCPKKLERGGNVKSASTSSSAHWYSGMLMWRGNEDISSGASLGSCELAGGTVPAAVTALGRCAGVVSDPR